MKNTLIQIKVIAIIFLTISCKNNDVINDNGLKVECLLKRYVINFNDSTRIELQLNHNDRSVVNEYIRNYVQRNPRNSKSVFLYYEENLGTDLKPYIVETFYPNSNTSSYTQPSVRKYYCSNDKKVTKIEYFSSSTSNYPDGITFNKYSISGNLIKVEFRYQNEMNGTFTGDYYVDEFEYLDGNNIKSYYYFKNGNTVQNRYLYNERVFTQYLRKANGGLGNLYNFDGERSKNYPLKDIRYDSNGIITSSLSYTYEFNDKGYVSVINEFNSSNEKRTYTQYFYQCQ